MPGNRRWRKGNRSTSRIGRLHKRQRDFWKRRKVDVDDNEATEDDISWEVPKDLEDIVEEIVADSETETVSAGTK